MSFGIFESALSSEQEVGLARQAAVDQREAAIYDVREKLGPSLFASRDLTEFRDRVAMMKNDQSIYRVIEPHIHPSTGVVRSIVGKNGVLEKEFRAKQDALRAAGLLYEGAGTSQRPYSPDAGPDTSYTLNPTEQISNADAFAQKDTSSGAYNPGVPGSIPSSAQPFDPAATSVLGRDVGTHQGGRRRADFDGTVDTDQTFKPSGGPLEPKDNWDGYLNSVDQGADGKVDRNFISAKVAWTVYADWCAANGNLNPYKLSSLDRYAGPWDDMPGFGDEEVEPGSSGPGPYGAPAGWTFPGMELHSSLPDAQYFKLAQLIHAWEFGHSPKTPKGQSKEKLKDVTAGQHSSPWPSGREEHGKAVPELERSEYPSEPPMMKRVPGESGSPKHERAAADYSHMAPPAGYSEYAEAHGVPHEQSGLVDQPAGYSAFAEQHGAPPSQSGREYDPASPGYKYRKPVDQPAGYSQFAESHGASPAQSGREYDPSTEEYRRRRKRKGSADPLAAYNAWCSVNGYRRISARNVSIFAGNDPELAIHLAQRMRRALRVAWVRSGGHWDDMPGFGAEEEVEQPVNPTGGGNGAVRDLGTFGVPRAGRRRQGGEQESDPDDGFGGKKAPPFGSKESRRRQGGAMIHFEDGRKGPDMDFKDAAKLLIGQGYSHAGANPDGSHAFMKDTGEQAHIRRAHRRQAAPDYLQKADDALTQLLNQKAQEFQETIAPLQQALTTVQQAEQIQQAQNPLNVLPPPGTVNVMPGADQGPAGMPAAGAPDLGGAAQALAGPLGGGGAPPPDAGGGAPPPGGGEEGGPPPAAAGGGLPPELMQQMQANRRRGGNPKGEAVTRPRQASSVFDLWDKYQKSAPTLRGDDSDYEGFASQFGVGAQALNKLKKKHQSPG